ncbi:uncharacterized protein LOC128854177 isoform X3 [Cuculus canorus]|uniref:uncharacterized protein LOC128854177 isoform X3 n=1 Tax=Cuculus canorus TaxID=55661 RepID=UPI0023AB2533|nr:uncharacterized protein LOC128854177 isoform X3 [Cuculus canorus]
MPNEYQIEFYGQYDSRLGVSPARSLFVGSEVLEPLDGDHRNTTIRDSHRKPEGRLYGFISEARRKDTCLIQSVVCGLRHDYALRSLVTLFQPRRS